MNFLYPEGLARTFRKLVDWETDALELALVMSDTTADSETSSTFVGDLTDLDECDGAGYARTALASKVLTANAAQMVLEFSAAQTDFPAIAASTRQVVGAVLLHNAGAGDATNPLLGYIDQAPWFPFNPTGNPARFKWGTSGTGIVRFSAVYPPIAP